MHAWMHGWKLTAAAELDASTRVHLVTCTTPDLRNAQLGDAFLSAALPLCLFSHERRCECSTASAASDL